MCGGVILPGSQAEYPDFVDQLQAKFKQEQGVSSSSNGTTTVASPQFTTFMK